MGNYLYQGHTEFRIPRDQEEPARQILIDLARYALIDKVGRCIEIQGYINTVNRGIESFSLEELVECWGWHLRRNSISEIDEIDGIRLKEEVSTYEDQLFYALGPFVPYGCYIVLSGDHTGGYWESRYAFTGSRMVEQEKEWPPIPDE